MFDGIGMILEEQMNAGAWLDTDGCSFLKRATYT